MIRAWYNAERARWEASTEYSDRDTMRAARWLWSPTVSVWWTQHVDNAAQLVDYMDTASAAALTRLTSQKQERIAGSNAQDADVTLPVPADHTYRPFQRAGIAEALERTHVLLADEMGLGKTVQAIGVLNADPSVRTVLVVCPSSLKIMWSRMLQEWSVRPVYAAIGSSRTPGRVVTNGERERENAVFALILNYDIVHNWRDYLAEIKWDMLIADEAHYLKSPDSNRTRAIVGGERKVRFHRDYNKGTDSVTEKPAVPPLPTGRRILMTGTPILNRPIELWPLLHYLDPQSWPRFWDYVNRYCGAYQDEYGWHMDGASHLEELNEKLRATVMVRRMKADVLTELPPKERVVIPLAANGAAHKIEQEHAQLQEHAADVLRLQVIREAARQNRANDEGTYKASVKALQDGYRVAFEHIARTRHDLALTKVPKVVEHVSDLLDGGCDKVVVFGHHSDVLDAIGERLHDYNPVHIDGRTPMGSRQAIADRFQTDDSVRVFIGGIRSAGEGLTLTAASTVVFAELDWTPARLSQAEDRLHRIGQLDSVLVQHILYDGSLDARMAKKLLAKQAIIDKAVNLVDMEDDPINIFDMEGDAS